MSEVLQGQDITITGTFLEYAGGPPAPVSAVTVTITSSLTGLAVVGPTATGVLNLATGVYSYTWSVPEDQAAGDYAISFDATDAQDDDVSTSGTFTVRLFTDETWATILDVSRYTGVAVEETDLFQAQAIIELFSGTTILASHGEMITTRNLRLLRMAVSYEAVFLKDHPGLFTDADVENYSQDGSSATYSHVNAALLAPLAKRCLDRLSWKLEPLRALPRNRRAGIDMGITSSIMDTEAGDKYLVWETM